jgi:hypothetical protein
MHLSKQKVSLQTHLGTHVDPADRSTTFAPAPVPEWVKDWLSRRRGTPSATAKPKDGSKPKSQPSIRLTETAEMEAVGQQRAHRGLVSSQTAVFILGALVLPPGISSPVRGCSPPRRFLSLSKALKSARALRSVKTSPFAKQKAFQPPLWLRTGLCLSYLPCSVAPPPSLANVALAMGMPLSPSSPHPPYRFTRHHHFDPEPRGHGTKVPNVECNQRVGPTIDCRFQHHLIARVPQLRSSQKRRSVNPLFPTFRV